MVSMLLILCASLILSTVWQIAQRDYKFGKGKHRSLTKATYDAVGDHFRKLWGKEAGWAHSVLFTADLRAFSDRLATKVEIQVEIKHDDSTNMVIKNEAGVIRVKRELDEEMIAGTPEASRRRASKKRRS